MKRVKKSKVCKLNLRDSIITIVRVGNTEGCYKIIVKFNTIIVDDNLALDISQYITDGLSYRNVKVTTKVCKNKITIEYTDYDNTEFASLDAKIVNDNGDNILLVENVVNVFIKD